MFPAKPRNKQTFDRKEASVYGRLNHRLALRFRSDGSNAQHHSGFHQGGTHGVFKRYWNLFAPTASDQSRNSL